MSKIESNDPNVVGLIVKGAAGQAVDLLQFQNSSGTVLWNADKDGAITSNYGRIYSVKDYGAKGDGLQSDSTGVQAAIDACYASTYSGIVYFPQGEYYCATPIQIKVKSGKGLIMEGTGRGTLISSGPGDDPGVFYHDGSGTSSEGLVIKNFNISGYGSHHPCLYLKDVAYFRLENLWLHNCNDGRYDLSDANAHGLYMNNCVSGAVINVDCDYNRGYGVYLWTSDSAPYGQNNAITFVRCHASNNIAGGFFNKQGVSDVYDGCCSEGNTGNGFDLTGTIGTVLNAPECEANGTDHIHLYGNNKSTAIISPYGDSYEGNVTVGVHIESSTGDFIVGNEVAGGILVDSGAGLGSTIFSDATVTNNGLARVFSSISTPVRYVSSAAASPPTLVTNGEVVVWHDSTNNKEYLMIRSNGATFKAECV